MGKRHDGCRSFFSRLFLIWTEGPFPLRFDWWISVLFFRLFYCQRFYRLAVSLVVGRKGVSSG